MKNSTLYFIYIAFTGLLIFSCGFAEEMTDRAADSPEGMDLAYVISLDNTKENVARDAWRNFIDQHQGKVMRIKSSSVQMAQNVAIAGLTGNITVKSLFEESGDNTEMRLWFVKDQKYMTPRSDPAAYDVIDRFIDEYFTELEAAQIRIQVENEQKELENLEKELKKLRKDNEKLHNDITKAEQTIKESRIKIEENLQEQDQMADKIQEQKDVIQQTQNKLSEVKSY